MPEIGEGGIKGFLKRIRGQTAKKEVAKPTTKVPEIQITQEEAERRRVLAENRRKQLQLVIHTDHVAIPDSVDIQNAVLEIEKGVTARSIEGKFPPEVRIKVVMGKMAILRQLVFIPENYLPLCWQVLDPFCMNEKILVLIFRSLPKNIF